MKDDLQTHKYYMEMALKEAMKGKGHVNPNPMVGAIIVKDNEIIAKGYHEKYKEAHAEVNVMNNSTKGLENSTMYVTLEPCFHYGNTPPCVDKIIENKISKVIIASVDPNPLVSGKSIEKLRKNNIEVITGILDDENKKLNEVFMKYIKSKEPFVIMKSAISLDGKISTASGESKWISSKKSRQEVQILRGEVSGILVGVNTIIKDNPMLTCRIENKKSPIRIVVDSKLRIPMNSIVVEESFINKTIIVTTNNANKQKIELLKNKEVDVLIVKSNKNRVDLKDMVRELGKLNIDSILLEGGSELNFSAIKENIVDKVQVYIAPKIIGGNNSKTSVGGEGFVNLEDCINLKDITTRQIDEDVLIEGYIDK